MTRKKHKDEPVRVATLPNATIAAVWVELLQREGILATLKCDDVLSVAYLVPSPYSCDIVVPPSQAERAREILASFEEEEDPFGDESDSDGDS